MASPFSSCSDISDSAIDAIIAETTDLCALEQIAALNTAHLSDSPLPSNLENRFRKLNSFPATTIVDKENIPRSLNQSENKPIPSEPFLFEDPKPEQPIKPEIPLSPKIREQKRSPSPPQQMCGCFGFSPRRIQRRGGSKDDDDDILSELEFGSSVLKEKRRKLKKVWREHEKASQEAEKMVKWVKQVSAKMNEAAIDELLKEEFK